MKKLLVTVALTVMFLCSFSSADASDYWVGTSPATGWQCYVMTETIRHVDPTVDAILVTLKMVDKDSKIQRLEYRFAYEDRNGGIVHFKNEHGFSGVAHPNKTPIEWKMWQAIRANMQNIASNDALFDKIKKVKMYIDQASSLHKANRFYEQRQCYEKARSLFTAADKNKLTAMYKNGSKAPCETYLANLYQLYVAEEMGISPTGVDYMGEMHTIAEAADMLNLSPPGQSVFNTTDLVLGYVSYIKAFNAKFKEHASVAKINSLKELSKSYFRSGCRRLNLSGESTLIGMVDTI